VKVQTTIIKKKKKKKKKKERKKSQKRKMIVAVPTVLSHKQHTIVTCVFDNLLLKINFLVLCKKKKKKKKTRVSPFTFMKDEQQLLMVVKQDSS